MCFFGMQVKAIVYFFVAAVLATMLYGIYVIAIGQSAAVQSALLKSFLLWLTMDFFFISTAEVWIFHILLPSLAMKDIKSVRASLTRQLGVMAKYDSVRRGSASTLLRPSQAAVTAAPAPPIDSQGQGLSDRHMDGHIYRHCHCHGSSPVEFNSAPYLMASYRIAQLMPEHPMSKLVLLFRSSLPPQAFVQASSKYFLFATLEDLLENVIQVLK